MNAPAASPTAGETLRIAIVDRCVPHYREGLYDVLMGDERMIFTIVAAAAPIERIGTVPFPGPSHSSPARSDPARPADSSEVGPHSPSCAPSRAPSWRWIDAPGYRIPGSRGASAWQWGAVKAGLSRRYDALIMMANPNDPSLWLCAIFARLTRKRLIFWTHGLTRRDRPLRRRLRVLWLRLAHAFAIYGHFGKVGMLGEGFDPARCHVCYNALDYSTQKSLRERITPAQVDATRRELFAARADAPLAISISRLSAFKKIDLLIRAHARLNAEGHRTNLLIVGDGAERARLEALVDELRVRDSVKFFGECYDEERLSLLIAASDLAVTPGAIGLTVMHSLAYGVPCVTHDDWYDHGPEFEAIIAGRTGDFFRKDDVNDLARVMRQWLGAGRKREVAAACIAHVERFYRPEVQAAVMRRALRGEPANDLWVAYQTPPAP